MNQIGTPMTVAAIVGNSITDNNYAYGVAVTGQSAPEGSWQYSLDGVQWTNFPAVTATQALLLAASDQVRFLPSDVSIGPATFSYNAWNETSGAAGTLADTTTNGGSTAFSTGSDTASIYVQMISSVTTDTLVGGVLTVNVDGPQSVTITTSGGDVLVNGANPTTGVALASAVTAIDITATPGAYDNLIDLTGVSAATGFTSLATVAINTGGSYSSDQVNLGLLNASGLVSVTGAGSDAVTMPSGLAAGSLSITATAISVNSVTTTGNQTYSGPVTLAGDSTLSAGSGNITFSSTLDGAANLTVDSAGVTTFGGTVGGITALSSLTTDAAGSTVLDASVTATDSGGITFNDPVRLGGNVTLDADVNLVTMYTVDGPYSLTFDTWNLALNGSIGANTPLASLSADVPFDLSFAGGSIITSGPQSYSSTMVIGGNTTFNAGSSTIQLPSISGSYNVVVDSPASLGAFATVSAGSGNVTFASTVDGGGLTVNTTGQTTFDGAVGQTSALNKLTISAGGTTVLAGGSIATTFGITFGSPVVLGSNMTIGNAGFSIVFDGTVDGDYGLTISQSGLPGTSFAAAVGGSIPLASLTATSGTLSIGNVTTVGAQTYNQDVQLDGVAQATSGAISISSPITLLGNSVISAGGAVNLNQVDGAFALNIVSGGLTTLGGQIGSNQPLTSLSVSSTAGVAINANVATSGNQVYSLPVTMAGGVTLTSTAGTVSKIGSVGTAPVLTPVAPTFAPVQFNSATSAAMTVAALVGTSITDDNDSYNIAVTADASPGGAWQYSLDGVNWINFPAVSGAQSLLLAAADQVQFVPDGVDTGTATFTYRAWNLSSGTAGTLVSTTVNGGNTAFSTATDTASIAIQIDQEITTDTLVGGVLTVDVTGSQNVTISSSGGNILVNGANPTTGTALASAVTAIDITATSGDYDNVISLTGVSAATGFTSLATVSIDTGGSYSSDQVNLGTLNASGLVSITGAGSDAVTTAASLVAGSVSITATAINLASVTTTGNQTYSGSVTLAANTTLVAGSGNVTFNGTLDGAHNLTIDSSGVTTFGGIVGGNTALSSLTTDAAGSTLLDASVTTSNSSGLTFNDPVVLGGNVTLAVGGNTVTMQAVDGPYSLAVNAWKLALDGLIGANTPLAALDANVTSGISFTGGSIVTSGPQTYGATITISGNTTLIAGSSTIQLGNISGSYNVTVDSPVSLSQGSTTIKAGSGNVTFASTVDGGSGGLTVDTTGQTTFDGALGQTTAVGSLTISAGGTTVLAGDSISTTTGITFGSPVVLGSNLTIGTGFGINFNGTVDGDYSLTISESGLSGTTFAAAVGGLTPLASLTVAGSAVSIVNVTTVGAQTYNARTAQLDGIVQATSGAISISSSTTLLGNTVINAGGAVNLNQVAGEFAVNVISGALTTLGGKVGQFNPPTSLTVNSIDGESFLANVTTSGNQIYTLPVTLASGVKLTSTAGTVSEIPSVNSAPILTPSAPSLGIVVNDQPVSTPITIAALVGNSITDNNDSYNIAVTGQSTPGGTWQYSLDGSNWSNFGAVSATQSLLLAASDEVRFAPDGVDTGTATFSYRAWNMATGTAGTLADTSSNGGNTAFSMATDMASILIQIPAVITIDTFSGGVLTVNVDGGQNVTITTSGGDVLVNGSNPTTGMALTSAVTAINITATAGTYDNVIDLSGVSNSAGFSSLATVTVNTGGSLTGDQVKLGTLNASGLVWISGNGSDTVTAPANLVAGVLSIAATTIDLNSVSTTGNQIYTGAVTIGGNATISAGSGNVTFDGTLDGGFNLSIDSSGITTFGGTVGGLVALQSLTTDAAGSTVMDASVSTGGSLNVNDPLTLGGNVTLGAGINTVNINNTIDGAYALTINTWNMSLSRAIGLATPLASLTVSVPFDSTFSGGSITTTGAQTYSGLTLGSDTTFNAGSAGINLGGLSGAYHVTLNSSGVTTLSGNIGGGTALASLTTAAAGTTDLTGNVTTTGNQTYNNPVSLGAFSTLNAGSGNVTFNSTVDNGGLTINSTGTTTFNAAVGGTNRLGGITIGAGGTTVLAGGSINTTFGITFNSPIVLGSDMTIATAGFDMDFNSTVNGDFNLTVGQSGFPGTTFAAAVGGLVPLASLTSTGGTLWSQNVTTVGSQTYNGGGVGLDGVDTAINGSFTVTNATTLLGNSVISAGGAVSLGQVSGKYGLNIVSGATTTLGGPIGSGSPLTTLIVSSTDGENINANVITSGNQVYTLPVNLAPGVSLTSTGGTVSEIAALGSAPVLTPIAPVLPPVMVNQPASAPLTVAALVGSSITDINHSYNIAITGESTPGGVWQYSLDGATWTNVGTVSATQSLLLAASDLVRFAPDAVDTGTATFTYRAWNMASGTAGTYVDTTTNGGNSAFSTATDTASLVVQVAQSIISDTFSGGVLTVTVAGSQNVTLSTSGGDVLVNGFSPTTGTALASAVTAINITAAAGAYNNVIDLSGVSASAGFSALATVTVSTGGSYSSDQVKLGTLNASGLVSISGSGGDAVRATGSLSAGSLSITATTITLTSVTTTGSQTYNGAVTLAANTTIASGSGNVSFNGTLDGGYNLSVDSSGVTTFGGTVGGSIALNSLTTDAAGTTVLDASATTSGGLTINDPLTLGGNVTLGAGVNTVSINNTIDGAYALTINTWNMSLTGAIGSATPLASLTVSVPFNSAFSGRSISTNGPQTYNTNLTLGADTTFNAGSSAISINGLNGAYNVTFDSSGLTTLSGNLGNSIALASVTTDAAGTTNLNGDVTTSGNQTYNDPVSLWAFTTLNAGSGNITFNNTVDSGGLTANTTGTTTFNGAVGKTAALGSLTIGAGGTTVLAGGSINATFGVTFNSPIVLGSAMTIANAGFAIEFNGTVDGDFSLSVGQSGFPGTTFAAAVGGLTPLASLTSAGGTLSLMNVTTVGSQTYSDRAVQLDGIEKSTAGAISISNAATLLGNTVINAAGAVNIGQVNGNFGLNIVSGALTTLGGSIGQTTPLTSVTVSSTSGEDINANVTTSGNQIYTLPVTVAPGATLTSTSGTVTESPAVDTAPVLTPIAPTLAPISVNQGTSSAVPVSTMVGNSITDDNHVYQIAVVGQSSAAGNWQYSLDGGTTWTNFGSVSVSQALLLDSNDLVQFVPQAGNTQTATFTYRAWNQSTGTPGMVADTSSNGGDTAFSTATDTASVTVDPAPTVMGAFVSSTAWAASYLSVLDAAGVGSSAASGQGFQLATGSDQLATTVAWTNVNEISIAFSGSVNVASTALTLYNSSNLVVPISSFSYSTTTNIATWEFASSLAAGKYVMNLAATSVTDTQGTELAGQWTTGTSTFAAGSGDGVAGEDFDFYFNVLPGDARDAGAVTNSDVLSTKLDVGAVANASNYRYDVNGQANITNSDVLLEKLQVGSNINTFATPDLPPESGSINSQQAIPEDDLATDDASGDSVPDSGAGAVTSTPASSTPVVVASQPAASAATTVISTDPSQTGDDQPNDDSPADADSSALTTSVVDVSADPSVVIAAAASPAPVSVAPAAFTAVAAPVVSTVTPVAISAQPLSSIAPVAPAAVAAPNGVAAATPLTPVANAPGSPTGVMSGSAEGSSLADGLWQPAAEPAVAGSPAPQAADALASVFDGLAWFALRSGGTNPGDILETELATSPAASLAGSASTPAGLLALDEVFSDQADHPSDDGRTFDRAWHDALVTRSRSGQR
ncbi:MAG TPA: hypothetical protein VHV55_24430 [Pirellulales bacterium]|nr:hypothetical protein [Pirellulales bacterium]